MVIAVEMASVTVMTMVFSPSQIPVKNSLRAVQTVCAVVEITAQRELRAPFTTPMAEAIFGPQDMTVLTAPAILGAQVIMVPTALITLPTTMSTGPMAATSSASVVISRLVPSDRLLNQSTTFCRAETKLRTAGIRISPKEMASSWSWDFRIVSWPSRLSCMVSAIFWDVPSQLAMAADSLFTSASDAFMMARKPDMAVLPTSVSAAAAFSDSVSPEKAVRQSMRMSFSSRMEPSALVVWMTTSPIASPLILISPCSSVMILRRDVPAWEDLMPAFAIRPMASAVSSAV